MKIAIDIRNIGKGRTGDEVVFFELVRHLALYDDKNTYHLLIDTRIPENLAHVINRLGIVQKKNFIVVQIGSGNKFTWNLWSVPQYCKREKIDIYHTQYIIPFFMPRTVKVVTHIHDVSFRVHKEMIKKTDAFFLNLLIPHAIKKSHCVIAVSQFTKDEIIKYYHCANEKVHVIYNAVSMHCDSHTDEMSVREKYTLPGRYIMALGTMQPRKNIPFLIEAFAEIAQEKKDLLLLLVGMRSHNFDRAIDNAIARYPHIQNRIILTGYAPDVEKCVLYKNAEIFVFPSLYEGFGIPILEARSMGTCVVASDIPSHREIADRGVFFFDPRSLDQCKKMLYDVLDNDKIKSDILTMTHENRFSWGISAQKLMRLYQSLE